MENDNSAYVRNNNDAGWLVRIAYFHRARDRAFASIDRFPGETGTRRCRQGQKQRAGDRASGRRYQSTHGASPSVAAAALGVILPGWMSARTQLKSASRGFAGHEEGRHSTFRFVTEGTHGGSEPRKIFPGNA